MIDRQEPAFDERNLFFLALLGLVSSSRRVDRWFARAPGERPTAAVTDVDVERDPVLSALLGLVSLGGTVRRHLRRALADERDPTRGRLPAKAAAGTPSLLR